jgi:hypothetical protein
VDGFAFASPRCSAYFLTHCHSDHTVGLRRDFAHTIYCSPVSARLLSHDWGLRAPQVKVLQLGQPLLLQGVTVTAIDANHCPGAIMLLFEVPVADGSITRVLHTGDFRCVVTAALQRLRGLQAIRRHMSSCSDACYGTAKAMQRCFSCCCHTRLPAVLHPPAPALDVIAWLCAAADGRIRYAVAAAWRMCAWTR